MKNNLNTYQLTYIKYIYIRLSSINEKYFHNTIRNKGVKIENFDKQKERNFGIISIFIHFIQCDNIKAQRHQGKVERQKDNVFYSLKDFLFYRDD